MVEAQPASASIRRGPSRRVVAGLCGFWYVSPFLFVAMARQEKALDPVVLVLMAAAFAFAALLFIGIVGLGGPARPAGPATGTPSSSPASWARAVLDATGWPPAIVRAAVGLGIAMVAVAVVVFVTT